MPEDFLTRYNTSSDYCDCPSFQYNNSTFGNSCKHIAVFNNPNRYNNWMDYRRRQTSNSTPQYDRTKWRSYRAKQLAEENSISYEELREHKVRWYEEHRLSVPSVIKFNGDQVRSYVNWITPRAKKFADKLGYTRSDFPATYTISMNEIRTKLGLPDILSHTHDPVHPDLYRTGYFECKCASFHYNPEFFCKHILQKKINSGFYTGSSSDLVFNMGYLERHLSSATIELLESNDDLENLPPLIPLELPLESEASESSEAECSDPFDNLIGELGQMKLLRKQIQQERQQLIKDQEDFKKKSSGCNVCYESRSIKCCNVCSGKLCVDCWKKIESRDRCRKCPYCRSQMEPLVDVLIRKFKQYQE